jgi:hypothetical protein
MIMSQGGDVQRTGHCHGAWGWSHWGDHRREVNDVQQKMEDHRRKAQEQFKEFGNLSSEKVCFSSQIPQLCTDSFPSSLKWPTRVSIRL